MVNNRSLYRSEVGYQAVMAAYEAALAQGIVPYTTQWVETRWGKTHVVIGGPERGEPLVLFHGWNGSAAGAFAQGMLLTMTHFRTQNNPGLIPDGELQRISCPTCLLISEHDLFHPAKGVARARRLIPGLAKAMILPDTGHILLEKPMKLVEAQVMRFLNEQ